MVDVVMLRVESRHSSGFCTQVEFTDTIPILLSEVGEYAAMAFSRGAVSVKIIPLLANLFGHSCNEEEEA